MDAPRLTRRELRALADRPELRIAVGVVRLHPVTVHELERQCARRGISRREALEDAVGLWVAREITREYRDVRVQAIRDVERRMDEARREADGRISVLREELAGVRLPVAGRSSSPAPDRAPR